MSDDLDRRHLFSKIKRLVVKVGTNILADTSCRLDSEKIESIAAQISALKKSGKEVVLVSSGAITAGMGALGMKCRPRTIPEEQAAAAVGQGLMMSCYTEIFRRFGIKTAQILLTQGDLRDRKRYLNARNTMMALLRKGVVPIVNENDTVAVDELVFGDRFGDNDILSALVAILSEGELLVMLTSVDGLFEGNKRLIEVVEKVTPEIESYARKEKSVFGKGGMGSKIKAAGIVTESGETAVIANGNEENVLGEIFSGSRTGTVFLPGKSRTGSRKRWIAYTLQPRGAVIIDDGAAGAIMNGKSLLPGGVVECAGSFAKGDAVAVKDRRGVEIARGLANYPAAEASMIKGVKTSEIAGILGQKPYDEVIHRDNMAVLTERLETAGPESRRRKS